MDESPLTVETRKALWHMSNGTELVREDSRIVEALIDDVAIFVATIGKKEKESVLHHLISQSVVPTLVRQKRFTPDDAREAVRLWDKFKLHRGGAGVVPPNILREKQAFSNKVTLAPLDTEDDEHKDFIFRVDVPLDDGEYRTIRTEVFPVEDFIAYYTDTSKEIQKLSPDQMMEEIERSGRGDPIAFLVARHLRVVGKDAAWIEQTSTMEGLIDAAYRLYCLTASHLLRQRQVSLYGLYTGVDEEYDTVGTRIQRGDLKQLYHGFTRTMSASAAEISSYFIGVPFNKREGEALTDDARHTDFFLPLGFSLLHFIRTRGHPDFTDVDGKLTQSIVTHALWDNVGMSTEILDAFQAYLETTPIGEKITISERSKNEMQKMKRVGEKNPIVRRLTDSLLGFAETMEANRSSGERSTKFEALVVAVEKYVRRCEGTRAELKVVDNRAANLLDQLKELRGTSISSSVASRDQRYDEVQAQQEGGEEWEETAALTDVHMTEGDEEEEEERFVSVLWHIGEHGREDAWASCSGSTSILNNAAEIWSKGGIVVDT